METGYLTALVLVVLLVFGVLYNALVEWLEVTEHGRGYTAFMVVGGVLATLLGFGVVEGWPAAMRAGLCFAASGLPMVIGSMMRSSKERKADEERAKGIAREMLNDESGGR